MVGIFLMQAARRGVVPLVNGIAWIRREHGGGSRTDGKKKKGKNMGGSRVRHLPSDRCRHREGEEGEGGWDNARQTRAGRRGRPSTSNLLQHANHIRQPNYHVLPQTKLINYKQQSPYIYLIVCFDCHMAQKSGNISHRFLQPKRSKCYYENVIFLAFLDIIRINEKQSTDAMTALSKLLILLTIVLSASYAPAFTSLSSDAGNQVWVNRQQPMSNPTMNQVANLFTNQPIIE